jgi:hypothetical protein
MVEHAVPGCISAMFIGWIIRPIRSETGPKKK